MYTIKVTYDTGDSFHNESGVVDTVGAVWENEEEALKALDYIEEHYKAVHQERGSWDGKEHKDKPWYEEKYYRTSLRVPVNGEMKKISAFWSGYFEWLHFAEVVFYEEEKNRSSKRKRYF